MTGDRATGLLQDGVDAWEKIGGEHVNTLATACMVWRIM